MTETDTTRRAVMLGASGAGLAVVLTACSGYGTSATVDNGGDSASDPAPASSAGDSGGAAGSGDSGNAAGLAKAADIPKGGGKIFKKQKIVVTQTNDGKFKAFTAVCTHLGCVVGSVSDGTINCPCHGSKFNIADGSVANGPATQPLAEKKIKVEGDSITLA